MISIEINPQVQRVIRAGYLLTIVALSVYAYITYRQLQALRNAPVALPNYWFYVVDNPVKSSLVQAHGSWVVAGGGAPSAADAATLQTSTIECRRDRQLCNESTASVSLKDGAYMEAVPTLYEVEQWTDDALVTKPAAVNCAAHVLKISFVDRNATKVVSLLPSQPSCKDSPRVLTLDSGSRSHQAPPAAAK